jgi:lipopolysaccharide/colanic/teichoic acid biosynthesis glycosyltransferase
MLLIAVLVKIDSPGPVIYRRRVLGLNGEKFDAFKFRTMVVNAEEILRQHPTLQTKYEENIKLKQDPRVTRLGHWLRRLSLDELPQLFNVLRREMSMVGPRMIAPEELYRYGEHATKRLATIPGITGLWQVSGRQDVSYEKRVELDLQYIDNWSLWLDLKILILTIPAVLRMTGAY